MADPITAVIVGGTALSAMGTLAGGEAAERSAELDALQLEQAAEDVFATGTRQASGARREGRFVTSKARSAIAASGAASDAGTVEMLAKIESEADYNSLSALYEAKTEAKGLRSKAAARRYEGRAAKRASRFTALGGALLGGAAAAK